MKEFLDYVIHYAQTDYHFIWTSVAFYEGLIAVIFSIWFFYKITDIKVNKFYERLFVALVFVLSWAVRVWNLYSILLLSILQLALFLLFYGRKYNRLSIVTVVTVAGLFDISEYFCMSILYYLKAVFARSKGGYYANLAYLIALVATLFYLGLVILVRKTKPMIQKRLQGEHRKLFLEVIAYFYATMYFITLMLWIGNTKIPLVVLLLTIFVGQFLYGSYIYKSR